MKSENPLLALKELVEKHGNQREAAIKLGVSPQYMSDMLKGYRAVSTKIAKKLGFIKKYIYVPIKNA